MLASASWDGTVKLWNLKGKEIRTIEGHSAPVNSVKFSPDGQLLVSAGFDHRMILLDLNTLPELSLGSLTRQACTWLFDYLSNSLNADARERNFCNTIIKNSKKYLIDTNNIFAEEIGVRKNNKQDAIENSDHR